MRDGKHILVSNRLRRRLSALGLASYEDYLALLEAPGVDRTEMSRFIDAVSTNETYFYRETGHFAALAATVLPGLLPRRPARAHLVRGQLHGRRSLHAADRLRRGRASPRRRRADHRHGHQHGRGRRGARGRLPRAQRAPRAPRGAADLLRVRGGGGVAGAPRAARAGRLPGPQPARRPRPGRGALRRHLLPQRDDLLRQADAEAARRRGVRARPSAATGSCSSATPRA